MPVKKPRGRKRPSHRRVYASVALVVLLGGSAMTYLYFTGYLSSYLSGGNSSSTNTSTSTVATGPGCPAPPPKSSNIFACVQTSQGNFEIELFATQAPKTVANFVSLAKEGFYNDLVWHRIVKGFVIQTGDPNTRNGGGNPNTWGEGGSNTTIPFENTTLPEDEGYIAMARGSAPNSATSQFFINIGNNTAILGRGYAVFGMVTTGIGVPLAIGNLPVASTCQTSGELECPPVQPSEAMLVSITILGS
ncbi:MAG TPA: peptidylprolyl isomerase [Nitrososphaerales archaeon]|nr:peptidylprolyl isomerase [Nitrososphaerales archaeon]